MQLIASKEEQQRRQKICDSCEHKNGTRCGVCGCFLIALRKWHIPNCPLNKHGENNE
jgi:hypothetical protein